MTDTKSHLPTGPAPAKMGKGLRAVLIGSLAVNLLFVGIIGGGMVAGRGMPHPFGGSDLSLGAFAEALDAGDRDAVRDSFKSRHDQRRPNRADRDAALVAFLAAVRTDPFDAAAIEAIFADQRDKATSGLVAGQEALLERLSAMTPEARAAFSDRLERRLNRRGDFDH